MKPCPDITSSMWPQHLPPLAIRQSPLLALFIPESCLNKLPQMWWLKNNRNLNYQRSEGYKFGKKGFVGYAPSGACRKYPSLALSLQGLQRVTGLWLQSTDLSVFTWLSSLCISGSRISLCPSPTRTPVIVRAQPKSRMTLS